MQLNAQPCLRAKVAIVIHDVSAKNILQSGQYDMDFDGNFDYFKSF